MVGIPVAEVVVDHMEHDIRRSMDGWTDRFCGQVEGVVRSHRGQREREGGRGEQERERDGERGREGERERWREGERERGGWRDGGARQRKGERRRERRRSVAERGREIERKRSETATGTERAHQRNTGMASGWPGHKGRAKVHQRRPGQTKGHPAAAEDSWKSNPVSHRSESQLRSLGRRGDRKDEGGSRRHEKYRAPWDPCVISILWT